MFNTDRAIQKQMTPLMQYIDVKKLEQEIRKSHRNCIYGMVVFSGCCVFVAIGFLCFGNQAASSWEFVMIPGLLN